MSYFINDEDRKLLDKILPDFEFNEVINISRSIRSNHTNADLELQNLPINLHAGYIREFLFRYQFAMRLADAAVINMKGMALKQAGSLSRFERMTMVEHDFLVIDDDKVNNAICKNLLHRSHPNSAITTYTDPNIGLRYIQDRYSRGDAKDTILLLDINMPTLLGWDVLVEFENFPDDIKRHFKILMFTSSIDPKDKERAKRIPRVWGYIEKPLNDEKIKALLF